MKSEGHSVDNLSVRNDPMKRSSVGSFDPDRKFYQEMVAANSEYELQSQIAFRRVDSIMNVADTDSPFDHRRPIKSEYSSSPQVGEYKNTTSYSEMSPSKKRWRKMGTIFKTLYFLKNPVVKRIENPVGLSFKILAIIRGRA